VMVDRTRTHAANGDQGVAFVGVVLHQDPATVSEGPDTGTAAADGGDFGMSTKLSYADDHWTVVGVQIVDPETIR